MNSRRIGWTLPVIGATLAVFVATGLSTWLQPRADYRRTDQGFALAHASLPSQSRANAANEVVTFFYPACPHCRDFEPSLEAWAARGSAQGDGRTLKRIPVTGGRADLKREAALIYALESLGAIPRLEEAVFEAVARTPDFPASDAQIASWAAQEGLSPAALLAAYHEPDMDARIAAGDNAFRALGLTAVPAVAVHDRWIVTPDTADGVAGMIRGVENALRTTQR